MVHSSAPRRDLQAALDAEKPNRAVQVQEEALQEAPQWAQMVAYLLAQAQQPRPQQPQNGDGSPTANGDAHPRRQNGEEQQQPQQKPQPVN